jgi:hypothetical protein
MKLNILRKPPGPTQGSVLIVTLTIMAIMVALVGSYLMIVQSQSASVARSQNWNSALPVTEAGLDEGMALINKGAPNIIANPWAWTNGVTQDGWSSFTNGQSSITRTNVSGSGSSYIVTVNITGASPVLTCSGLVPFTTAPWVYGSGSFAQAPRAFPYPFVAAIGVTQLAANTVTVGRKVSLQTVLNPLFGVAVLTRSNFNMNGNGTTVDAFNSTNPLYSVLGQYSAALRMTNGGDIATDSAIVGDISLGNGNIYGHVFTGPGTAASAVQVGANGAVGSTIWQASNSGIQPGYWAGDFNIAIPDVPNPTFVGQGLPAPTNGAYQLNGGTYTTASGLTAPLNITGPTILWLQNSLSQGITIASTNNASLVIFIGTTNTGNPVSVSIGGNGSLNSPGYAKNLQIYGLPSLTSISFQGNGAFAGTIYAPEADMSGGGGGNNNTDTSGSMVVKSVTLNGHWNFHYDQSLKTAGPTRGWVPSAWTEVKYP